MKRLAEHYHDKVSPKRFGIVVTRGVPIIRSATISATDMAFFTNIRIGTEQQEDQYRYRYLYSSNDLYINGLCIGFLRYSCGSLVPVAYCSLCNKRYATRRHINTCDSSVQSLQMKQL